MEDVVAVVILSDGTERLLGGDFRSLGHADILESAIDRDVAAVAYHDDVLTTILEDAADGAFEHRTCLGALLSSDVDALVVEGDIAKAWHGVGAVVTDNAVGTGDGHGQTASVGGEVGGELAVGSIFFEPAAGVAGAA